MQEFPLPALTQDQYSTYYGKKIPRDDNLDETIVYPGFKLPCPAKSRSLKKKIKPKHVFITKLNDSYIHRIYGSDKQWSILPKRLHSLCFPKIHLSSIPSHNRIKIQITDSIHQVLPFIPDEFYKQKQQKAEKTNKPVTRRLKRQRVSNQNTIQNDDNYVGWQQSLHKTEEKTISKEELINNIRFAIDNIHENKLAVKHPFENIIKIQDNEDAQQTFVSIVEFVYHYIKDELRMQPVENKVHTNELWETIQKNFY
jgi:hypothetical protein